jgi:hypothetical protein
MWRSFCPVNASQYGINVIFDAAGYDDVFHRHRTIQQIASPLVTSSAVLLNPCHEFWPPCLTACHDHQYDHSNGLPDRTWALHVSAVMLQLTD